MGKTQVTPENVAEIASPVFAAVHGSDLRHPGQERIPEPGFALLHTNDPVFAKFKCSANSVGRWDIVDCRISIKIGNTEIHPGDFVFGDIDGVVVIPKDMTMDVVMAAEDVFERERAMRQETRRLIPCSKG